jgi:hypothetical protein
MPLMQDIRNLFSDGRDVLGIPDLQINRLYPLKLHEVTHDADGNQDGLIRDFALAEGACLFTKNADDRELQLADFEGLTQGCVFAPEEPNREFVRDHGHSGAKSHVAFVKTAPVQDQQISDSRIILIDTVDRDRPDFAVHDDLGVHGHDGGCGDDLVAQSIPERLDIRDLDEIAFDLGRILAALLIA